MRARRSSGSARRPQLARARTILLELERIWSHLNDIAAVCAGVGLAAGNNHFAALTERARRLNARLTGHRFLFGAIEVGEAGSTSTPRRCGTPERSSQDVRTAAESGWRELQFNASFQDRLPDVGDPPARGRRAPGHRRPCRAGGGGRGRLRSTAAGLDYPGFEVETPERPAGDVRARPSSGCSSCARHSMFSTGCSTARSGRPQRPGRVRRRRRRRARRESARGSTLCVVERDGDRIGRVHLRTGSYANWPSVAFAAADNLLPDFPLINKSFELCYACADR